MGERKNAVTLLLTHWSYCSLELTYQYSVKWTIFRNMYITLSPEKFKEHIGLPQSIIWNEIDSLLKVFCCIHLGPLNYFQKNCSNDQFAKWVWKKPCEIASTSLRGQWINPRFHCHCRTNVMLCYSKIFSQWQQSQPCFQSKAELPLTRRLFAKSHWTLCPFSLCSRFNQ